MGSDYHGTVQWHNGKRETCLLCVLQDCTETTSQTLVKLGRGVGHLTGKIQLHFEGGADKGVDQRLFRLCDFLDILIQSR